MNECSKKVYELCVSENDENIKVSNAPETFKMWSKGHSNFAWNQILANWNGPKMSFLAILEVLSFDFSTFEQLSSPKFTKKFKVQSF